MTHVNYTHCKHLKPPKVSEYTEQAEAFLVKHDVHMTIAFMGTDLYFDDDKAHRNTFRWTLRRNGERITGNFGDSIHNTENNECPTAYDILSTITKSDPGTFIEFCSDFGYSNDAINARTTYLAVKAEFAKLSRIFNHSQFLELQEIN